MLLRRLLAGTIIALVIKVYAISTGVEPMFGAVALHHRKQLIFAVEAALRVVADVVGVFQFLRLDHLAWDPLLFGEPQGIFKLRSRQRRRVGDERQHIFA